MNINTQYEVLAKEIYENILAEEGMGTIIVQHNVSIRGAQTSQKHQLDVYWEVEIAGVTHRVAIECKNYSKKVSLGNVRSFAAALDDIGNIQGIFITKIGYQSGAKTYGLSKGLQLKCLREPKQEDFDKLPNKPKLVMTGNSYFLDNVNQRFHFDINWCVNNTPLKEGQPLDFNCMDDEIHFLSKTDSRSLLDLRNQLPRKLQVKYGCTHTYKFDNDTYISWPNDDELPPLKINAVSFNYDVIKYSSTTEYEGYWIAKNILEDIVTGKIYFHNKNGRFCQKTK